MLARTEELAELMTAEMGKPLPEARGEVAYAADLLTGSRRKPCASPAATLIVPTVPHGTCR